MRQLSQLQRPRERVFPGSAVMVDQQSQLTFFSLWGSPAGALTPSTLLTRPIAASDLSIWSRASSEAPSAGVGSQGITATTFLPAWRYYVFLTLLYLTQRETCTLRTHSTLEYAWSI